mmetsp:Transcript_3924/g.8813  ORF Transcript_3924/g.8813 Transcript_3924/m.8813 type:complete len:106 (+) Transcript_3924:442-759(+)
MRKCTEEEGIHSGQAALKREGGPASRFPARNNQRRHRRRPRERPGQEIVDSTNKPTKTNSPSDSPSYETTLRDARGIRGSSDDCEAQSSTDYEGSNVRANCETHV